MADIDSLNDQIVAGKASLPALEKLVQTYEQAEKSRYIDALTLYSARYSLLQKKIDLAKLRQQLMQNWIALEIAAGRYLPCASVTTRPTTAPGPEETR